MKHPAGHVGIVWLLGIAAAVLGARPGWLAAQAQPEFRGMWVSRFEWPSTSMSTVIANIDSIMSKLATHRFNAVIFQVRGQADTLYPSPYEPWSQILSSSGNTPAGWGGFDPLAYAINAAHARGLEFHAYINTHVCFQSGTPNNPNHVFWQHCNASNPSARDWLIHNSSGTPVQYSSDDYVWMAPGVPDMQAYVRKQVLHVVRSYNVDGVHFDRIRMPSTEYSHDPISEARRAGEGNPNNLSFADWTRDQFTRFLRDLYAQIMEVKPHIKVSSAPLGLYRQERYPGYPSGFLYGYSKTYQDAQAWIGAGAMDFLVPQIYWSDGGNLPDFSDLLPDWLANRAGRHIYAGHNQSTGIAALLQDVQTTRSMGGEGTVIWSYNSFNSNNYWSSYSGSSGPYAQPAPVPDMPWKTNPSKGIIIGTVTQTGGTNPIVDARVTRSGSTYVALSSGDGLYSFLEVTPGTYTLSFNKQGVGTAQAVGVPVVAGQVTRVDVTIPDSLMVTISAEPMQIELGQAVQFTPVTVVPQGETILSYTWHFGDGDLAGGGAPTPVNHVYTTTGLHTAYLSMTGSVSGMVTSNQAQVDVVPPPGPPGDFDFDNDVDLEDFAHLQECLSGTALPQDRPECQNAKLDGDTDVDQSDVDIFLKCLSGPNIPADPGCAFN